MKSNGINRSRNKRLARRGLGLKICCRREPDGPEQHGAWTQCTAGERFKPDSSVDWYDMEAQGTAVILPCYFAVAWSPPRTAKARCRSLAGEHNGRALFATLPNEVLAEILQYLIPAGKGYHFSPCTKKHENADSIHYLSSPSPFLDNAAPGMPQLVSLALTSRIFQDVAYGLFYGRNQFVFEIAARTLTSHVDVVQGCSTPFDDWNRVMASPSDNCLWPLTEATARYVKDLTLCVYLSPLADDRRRQQRPCLARCGTLATCSKVRRSDL